MKKLYLLLVAVVLLLNTACSEATLKNTGKELEDTITNISDADNKYVRMVKGGYRTNNPDLTYDKAFSAFFGTPRWKYFKSDDESDVVEFTGDCTYHDAPVKARIQFKVDEENGTFEATYLAFNEVPQTMLILASLIEKAFEGDESAPSGESQTTQDMKFELDNEVSVEYISINIPSSWSYYYDGSGGYIYFDINCQNDDVIMSVFESRDITEDVRRYNFDGNYKVKPFAFENDPTGECASDDSKIIYTYDMDSYVIHYMVDYSSAPDWYNQNKELIDQVAKTLKFTGF